MSTLRINLIHTPAEDENPSDSTPETEETIIVPNTGSSSSNASSIIDFSAVIITTFILFLIAFLLYKKYIKHSDQTITKKLLKKLPRRLLPILVFVTISSLALGLSLSPNFSSDAFAVDPDNPAPLSQSSTSSSNSLSVTINDLEANLTVDADGSDLTAHLTSEVVVSTPAFHGYHLSLYTDSKDLKHETKDAAIKGIDAPGSLSSNTWGVSLTDPTNLPEDSSIWQPMPTTIDTALTIKSTTSPTLANDTTLVYYGVKVNNKLPEGTYQGTINYVIVANVMDCPALSVCYDPNWASDETSMGNQSISSNDSTINLWASNFKRDGYGFAGWNTKADGTGTSFGPNETIADEILINEAKENGLILYANWLKSAGSLQNWTGCSAMNIGDVTALTDERDNDTYAVAKLKDNNCWMIENLRLDNDAAGNTTGSLAQGYALGFIGLANAESDNFSNSTTANSLYSTNNIIGNYQGYRFPRYNNQNTASPDATMTAWNTDSNTYSIGNWYTWPAAVADTDNYTYKNLTVSGTSICPTGWKLPSGGSSANAASSDFWQLGLGIMGFAPSNTYFYRGETNTQGQTASAAYRGYPNNFIYSGGAYGSMPFVRSLNGFYWSSTVYEFYSSYSMYLDSSSVDPGTGMNGNKVGGFSVRCLVN